MLHNQGDGTFGPSKSFKVGVRTSFQLTIGDLNGDGAPDMISEDITSSISVLTNGATATAMLTDIAVPGGSTDTEKVTATYVGDSRYTKSRSKAIEVTGSGSGLE